MKYAVAILALAASVSAQTPPGCSENFSGTFEISPINATTSTKRGLLEAVGFLSHPGPFTLLTFIVASTEIRKKSSLHQHSCCYLEERYPYRPRQPTG